MKRSLVALALVAGICHAMGGAAPVVDSRMTFEEALGDRMVPDSIQSRLRLVAVRYWGFDDRLHEGQILCNQAVVEDIEDLFELIEKIRFPVRSAIPISRWNGSDSASMAADNTYGFAWRGMWGSSVPSWHMKGLALDINPRENPAFKKGRVFPPDAALVPGAPGTLSDTSAVVRFLKKRGWKWGARWRRVQDWQHFEKPLR
ncbi:MAG TPA: M15 family metallopeptidase [Fibrobacteria bacterium]|nr:M15 family metallopeptidase [Fibrobacteria bacterium]